MNSNGKETEAQNLLRQHAELREPAAIDQSVKKIKKLMQEAGTLPPDLHKKLAEVIDINIPGTEAYEQYQKDLHRQKSQDIPDENWPPFEERIR